MAFQEVVAARNFVRIGYEGSCQPLATQQYVDSAVGAVTGPTEEAGTWYTRFITSGGEDPYVSQNWSEGYLRYHRVGQLVHIWGDTTVEVGAVDTEVASESDEVWLGDLPFPPAYSDMPVWIALGNTQNETLKKWRTVTPFPAGLRHGHETQDLATSSLYLTFSASYLT